MPAVKQLYEPLSQNEIAGMSKRERADRLALCEHQLANKQEALGWIEAKPYMLKELAGLQANILALKSP